mgnify:CR=1 FL=1
MTIKKITAQIEDVKINNLSIAMPNFSAKNPMFRAFYNKEEVGKNVLLHLSNSYTLWNTISLIALKKADFFVWFKLKVMEVAISLQ